MATLDYDLLSHRPANMIQIRYAQPGSDIHGVLERIARNLHLGNPKNPADQNWFNAQAEFSRHAIPINYDKPEEVTRLVPITEQSLHQYLEKTAFHKYHFHRRIYAETLTSLEAWNLALDELANSICPVNGRIATAS